MYVQEKIQLLYSLSAVLAQTKDTKTIEETNNKIREIVHSIEIPDEKGADL